MYFRTDYKVLQSFVNPWRKILKKFRGWNAINVEPADYDFSALPTIDLARTGEPIYEEQPTDSQYPLFQTPFEVTDRDSDGRISSSLDFRLDPIRRIEADPDLLEIAQAMEKAKEPIIDTREGQSVLLDDVLVIQQYFGCNRIDEYGLDGLSGRMRVIEPLENNLESILANPPEPMSTPEPIAPEEPPFPPPMEPGF